jgi:hypothetical protein
MQGDENLPGSSQLVEGPQSTVAAEPVEVRAWEQVDEGRYMPRRIKGSCKGRALG